MDVLDKSEWDAMYKAIETEGFITTTWQDLGAYAWGLQEFHGDFDLVKANAKLIFKAFLEEIDEHLEHIKKRENVNDARLYVASKLIERRQRHWPEVIKNPVSESYLLHILAAKAASEIIEELRDRKLI